MSIHNLVGVTFSYRRKLLSDESEILIIEILAREP